VDQEVEAPKLSRFYEERADYHEMTASEDKINHPQVRLLLELIRPTDTIVDFGCGGGVALSAAGERAQEAIGIDIGGFALAKANSRPGKHRTIKSDIAKVPLSSDYADIAYSFEVLEHVWDPAAVIREMVRVLKPGGTLLITTPNGFTMNLHLHLRPAVRFIHHLGAAVTLATAAMRTKPYQNIPPNLDVDSVYPDCDMITRIHPRSLKRFALEIGCEPLRIETFYFLRKKSTTDVESQRFERLEAHPFYHWHGDHILFLGRKMRSSAIG
jgi:SAM-dependent methyltransferase